jgi:hypothetical protein
MAISDTIKNLKDNLPKPEEQKATPINTLPEYEIRTMKDDLAELTVEKLEKEAKGTKAPEEIVVVSKPWRKKKEITPPPPVKTERKRAPLPSAEELLMKKPELAKRLKKELPKPPEVKPLEPAKPEAKPSPPPVEAKGRKKPKLIIILIIAILILAGVVAFFYWQGKQPSSPEQPTTEEPGPEEPQPPGPEQPELSIPFLIPANKTKILSLSPESSLLEALKTEAQLEETTGIFKRIIILKQARTEERKEHLSLTNIFQRLGINILPYALAELKENYNLILYSQNGKTRLGLITEIENPENLKEQLRFWEETMFNDLKNMFLGETPGGTATSKFHDNIYKEIPIRYINFPEPDLTIDYAIVNNLFVLTTSKESMYRIIDGILP